MQKLLLFAIFGISVNLFSQYSIQGSVKDENNTPLIGSSIFIKNSFQGTSTDKEGNFVINSLNTGEYTVVVSYMGYEQQKHKINLKDSYTLNVELKPSSILTEEVVVRAVRAEDIAPVAQTTLERNTIQNVYNGEHPIFVINELSPSVTTESESGTSFANYGSMRLRGLDQHRINITLNGVPLNDMIDHGVYFSNFTDIGNSFESVQVQRGVGTSSNGVASYAGSINFESVNLEKLEAGSEVQMGYGSFNSSRINGQFNSGMVSNKWSFHGSYSRLYSDGYKNNTESNAYSFFFSGGYFSKKHIFKLNAFDARSKNGLGYEAVDLQTIEQDPEFNPLNENDKDDFGQQFVQLQHIYKYNNNFNISNSLYYNGAGGDFLWGYIDSVLVQYNYPLTNRHYGFISNLHYSGIDKLKINGGIHLYTFKRNNLEQVSPDFANPYYNEKSKKNEFSIFVKGEYKVNSVIFFGDIQYRYSVLEIAPDFTYLGIPKSDNLSDKWSFLNPKVGITYLISKQTNIYASVGITNREPRKTDILGGYGLYSVEMYDSLRRGIDFLSEKVTDYEFGFKHHNEKLFTNVNFFFMDFVNGILENGETIAFGSKVRNNVPQSYRSGAELSLSYLPFDNIQLIFYGTYMKSEIKKFRYSGDSAETKGVTPILSPEWILNGTLNYNPVKNIQVSLSGRYVSDSYMSINNDEDFVLLSYFLLNGRISAYFLKKHSISVEINNITNTDYYTNGSPVDTDGDWIDDAPGYFVNAPVNFFGTLTLRF